MARWSGSYKTADDVCRELNGGLDIFLYYMAMDGRYAGKEIRPHKKFLSPLRDEKDPSFEIYKRNTEQDYWYSDFNGERSGSPWDFVMRLFGIDFTTAFKKVKSDLLGEIGGVAAVAYARQQYASFYTEVRDKTLFTPEYRYHEAYDMAFWNQFLIYPDVLQLLHMHPVSSYQMQKGNKSFRVYNTPYDPVYFIDFPNVNRQKIYRPFAKDRRYKWVSNLNNEEDIFGFDIMPPKADKGFLMAGNKDTGCAFSLLQAHNKYPVIAMSSEVIIPSSPIWMIMQSITPNWYSIYDNDPEKWDKNKNRYVNTGREMSAKLEDQLGIIPVRQPIIDVGEKDFSAMVATLLRNNRQDELRDIKRYYEEL